MKFFVCIFFCILMTVPVAAAEKVEEPAPPPQKQPVLQNVERKASPPAKRDFQPTERIKADTVVAFPADI